MGNWFRVWIVPGAVFQSVMVGGGYGTGREVVEFVSRHGPLGGLAAIALIGLLLGLVLAVSFDFAREFQIRDYRLFFKKLLGRYWVLFEMLFILGLILILAVAGFACGEVLHDRFSLPPVVGVVLMLLIVALLSYCGRQWVEKVLAAWGLLMTLVLLCFLLLTFIQRHEQIFNAFISAGSWSGSAGTWSDSWWLSGIQFFLYNALLVPVVLYATEAIVTRKQAWGAGVVAGLLGVLPGLIFHLAFMAGYPAVLEQPLPTYWMMQQLGMPLLLLIYVVILFGTMAQTGVGVLQGVNERLDNWWRERSGQPLRPWLHSVVAAGTLLVSLLLAKIGIVLLVAKGYGSLAWLALVIYIVPLFTLGLRKLKQQRRLASSQFVSVGVSND